MYVCVITSTVYEGLVSVPAGGDRATSEGGVAGEACRVSSRSWELSASLSGKQALLQLSQADWATEESTAGVP